MKKTITLLLALVMCLSLAACGNEEPAAPVTTNPVTTTAPQTETAAPTESVLETEAAQFVFNADDAVAVIGKWSTKVSVNPANLGVAEVDMAISVPATITFDDAGVYTIDLDPSSFAETAKSAYAEALAEQIYADYAEQQVEVPSSEDATEVVMQGMDKAAADEDMLSSTGMNVTDYAASMADSMGFDSLLETTSLTGNYLVDGTSLHIDPLSDNPTVITFQTEEEEMIMAEASNKDVWKSVYLKFPLVLNKEEQ